MFVVFSILFGSTRIVAARDFSCVQYYQESGRLIAGGKSASFVDIYSGCGVIEV